MPSLKEYLEKAMGVLSVKSFIPTYISAWGSTWVPYRKGQTISLTINGTAFPSIRFVKNQVYAME